MNGWALIEDLITKSAKSKFKIQLNYELILEVVRSNDKKRFAISEDGLKIRANQGHSLDINLGLTHTQPPKILYHGTASRFIDTIKASGLVTGERQYVHLSENKETANQVGQRYGKPIILIIDAQNMVYQGHLFYQAENGVWLTNDVPVNFIRVPK